jgi:isopentenyldiphosphate isomerase
MRSLTPQELDRLQRIRQSIRPLEITHLDLQTLKAEWEPIIQPPVHEKLEQFSVVDATGKPTGAVGPRWLFHRFGLPHRAAHVGLTTSNGLVLLQRRSRTKADNPHLWDMPASGHVAESASGHEVSVDATALRELGEELFGVAPGGSVENLSRYLQAPLQRIGEPFKISEQDEGRNPPHYNTEVVQVFAGVLTFEGIACLRPDPDELAGVFICPIEEAWRVLKDEDVAPAGRVSLHRYLEWLERQSLRTQR